jgi:hypothetical protein
MKLVFKKKFGKSRVRKCSLHRGFVTSRSDCSKSDSGLFPVGYDKYGQ